LTPSRTGREGGEVETSIFCHHREEEGRGGAVFGIDLRRKEKKKRPKLGLDRPGTDVGRVGGGEGKGKKDSQQDQSDDRKKKGKERKSRQISNAEQSVARKPAEKEEGKKGKPPVAHAPPIPREGKEGQVLNGLRLAGAP